MLYNKVLNQKETEEQIKKDELQSLDEKFVIYYLNETGVGFHGDSDIDNAKIVDIDEAIDFLNIHGISVDDSCEENGINYMIVSDYSRDQGIPGLAIPEILYDYLIKKGYVRNII